MFPRNREIPAQAKRRRAFFTEQGSGYIQFPIAVSDFGGHFNAAPTLPQSEGARRRSPGVLPLSQLSRKQDKRCQSRLAESNISQAIEW
jgi:hypothetical protein